MLVLGTVGIAGALTLDGPAMPEPTRSPDQATEVAPPDEPPPTAPRLEDVDPDAAQDLRAAIDPDRPRCEPQGCERWFRALGDTMPVLWANVADGRVSLVDGDEVVVLDLATGTDVLRIGLEDLVGATSPSVAAVSVRSWPIEGGVAAISDRAIAVADLDGTLRWGTDTDAMLQYADTSADHLHVVHIDDGRSRTRSYRLRDGGLALDRADTMVLSAEPLILIENAASRTVVAGLTADLDERWRTELSGPQGHAFGGQIGEVVVVEQTPLGLAPAETGADDSDDGVDGDGSGTTVDDDPEVAVLDPRDGRTVARLPGASVASIEVDGLAVLLVATPDTHRRLQGSPSAADDEPFRFRLVAVGADRLHLDVEVATARTAGPDVRLWPDDAGVLLALGDDAPQRIDLDTGALTPAPDVEVDDGHRLQLDERTTLIGRFGDIGLDDATLERAGRRTQLSGATGWPIVAGDDVLVVGDRSLMLVDPDVGRPITP